MRTVLAALLTWMVLVPAAAASEVVVGVAGLDGRATRLLAIDLDTAGQRLLGDVHHAAGATPTGTLLRNGQLALVMPDDGRLIVVDLTSNAIVVDERALDLSRNQRPQESGALLVAVRQHEAKAQPEVLDLRTGQRVFAVDVPWLSTVEGSTSVFLASGTGVAERIDWHRGALKRQALGVGAFRHAALRADGSLIVEVQLPSTARAHLVQIPAGETLQTAKQIAEGLAGFSPVVGGRRAAAASGRKDGSLVVDDGTGFVRWRGARAGVARPQAITSSGTLVVVALVDRGAALPAELWALTSGGGALLLAPPVGDVVTVYGVSQAVKP